MRMGRLLAWIGGFLFSVVFIWGVSAVFSNSIVPLHWSGEIEGYVPVPGSVSRFRSEGWADTVWGQYGFTRHGERVLHEVGSKYYLWGDSFVEALQVGESDRVAEQFNRMSRNLKAVAVAHSGLGVPDYYFKIPLYEALGEKVDGHVILLVGLDDVLPGQYVDCHSRFLADPWRFESSTCTPSELALRYAGVFSRWRLEFLYDIYSGLKRYSFRFSLGDGEHAGQAAQPVVPADIEAGWDFLTKALVKETAGFVVFVYVPRVPFLQDGRMILADPEGDQKELFRQVCERNGIGFVDMSDAFVKIYTEKGRLPRGFFNSPPGTGHLNREGQRLIAEGLKQYFERRGP